MEEQIFKLIYDYSVNGKVADEAFIDKIVELVVNTRELNSLVSGISYSNDLEEREGSTEFSKRKVVATHSIDTGIITFNMENIYNYDRLKIDYIDFNEFDVLITKNMEIAHIILHELEHVYQRKMFLSNNKDTIENKIVYYDYAKKEELINLINKYNNGEVSAEEAKPVIKDYYHKKVRNYNYSPIERFAEINSYKVLASSVPTDNKSLYNVYKYVFRVYLCEHRMGYNLFGHHLTPTECYLTDVVGEDAWKDIDTCTSDVNDLFDRLYLGLSITPQDFRDLHKILRDFNFKRENKRRRRH